MKFKEVEDYSGCLLKMNPPMPEPEVGKIYHSFEDHKAGSFRLSDWKIVKRIDLDSDKVSKYLLEIIQDAIEGASWLFDAEQTVIFFAEAVDDTGKYDNDIGTCYFIRTTAGGWYILHSEMFWQCELDVDNRWYNGWYQELHQTNVKKAAEILKD